MERGMFINEALKFYIKRHYVPEIKVVDVPQNGPQKRRGKGKNKGNWAK